MTIYYGLLPVIDIYYNRRLDEIFVTNLNNCSFFCLQLVFYFKTLWVDKHPSPLVGKVAYEDKVGIASVQQKLLTSDEASKTIMILARKIFTRFLLLRCLIFCVERMAWRHKLLFLTSLGWTVSHILPLVSSLVTSDTHMSVSR